MYFSLGLIMLSGLVMGQICKKIKLPPLFGMIIAGIVIGPYVLNLIDKSVLDISSQLRKIALIIILSRAGLSLNIADLKKVGRPAVLMCFVPACFEILGMALLAPKFLGISLPEALVMGAVVGAVSPAVIVPKMIKLMEDKWGTKKSIPQMILAGASVDDVFVIVMFYSFTHLVQTNDFSAVSFVKIPVSVFTGIAAGAIIGCMLGRLFKKTNMRTTVQLIILMSVSFMLVAFEDKFSDSVPFSALISVMCIGIAAKKTAPETAAALSAQYSKLWIGAEIMLFVLVGAAVNINYALKAGMSVILLIPCVLVFRMAGVFICMTKTGLNMKERLFCMIAYMPKATVQAAIGGIPLAMGLACGEIVLTVAVVSILLTAPLGAFLIDVTHKRLLERES